MENINYFSLHWFNSETINSFDWQRAYAFNLLWIVPLLFLLRWLFLSLKRKKIEVAFFKKDIKSDWSALLVFIPNLIFYAFLCLIIIALAGPQRTNEKVDQWTEGIDIMLVLDISSSMKMPDFKPNRLEAAKKVAKQFINGRNQDRIGLVVFSGLAHPATPLTLDYQLLNSIIDEDVKFGKIPKDGTAIGMALTAAVSHMEDSEAKSKVIILLTDGDNTAGNIDPKTAAQIAYAYGIKIYTIGVGREGKIPITDTVNTLFGPREVTSTVESHLEEGALREIAKIGEGKFFRATNNNALQEIFKIIDTYEKAEIKENRYKNTSEYYYPYLFWGICFFLIWMLLKSSFMTSLIND